MAAAMGSYGAALVGMVTGLSLSGRRFVAIKEEMLKHRHAVDNDRGVLMDLVEKDSAAFDEVMATFKMSEETVQERKQKENATEAATIHAAEVPLSTMRHSYEALNHAKVAMAFFNQLITNFIKVNTPNDLENSLSPQPSLKNLPVLLFKFMVLSLGE